MDGMGQRTAVSWVNDQLTHTRPGKQAKND